MVNADNGSDVSLPAGVTPVDPTDDSETYSAILYNNKNGLPTSEANDIVQTSDGFIWIGMYSGLIRYDGDTFEKIGTYEGIGSVVYLYVDQQDRLWIATNDGGLVMNENNEFRFWKEADGLPSVKVTAIGEDGEGNVYVGTTAGIVMMDEDLNIVPLYADGDESAYIENMKMGSDGVLYAVTNTDMILGFSGGEMVRSFDGEAYGISNILYIHSNPLVQGEFYICADDTILYSCNLDEPAETVKAMDIAPLNSVIEICAVGGQIWLAGRNGIGVIDQDSFHIFQDLPVNNSVTSMMCDSEGNLWFASTRQGVMKIVKNRFVDVTEQAGIASGVVNGTCVYDDMLMIGTDTGLIVLDQNQHPVPSIPLDSCLTASGAETGYTDLISLFENTRIRSIIPDSKDRLWFSTWHNAGLVCYDHGAVTIFDVPDGALTNHFRTVLERPDGSILAVNSGGLLLIEDGKITRAWGIKDGIENTETLSVSFNDNGDILVGSNGGGIYVLNPDKETRTIGTEDGLTSGVVMRIKRDEKRNLWWIITSNSLEYMDEDYHVTKVNLFPYNNNYDLYENSKGDMWVLSSDGIYVVPADDLVANESIDAVHFSIANGMPSTATANSYNELTEDGNLYISGSTGVTKVNIDKSLEAVENIKVAVPYMEADGIKVYPDEDGVFRLNSSVKKLTIYSYVLSYSLTDPKVSCQLVGFDDESPVMNRSDVRQISYTNLRGGEYTFKITVHDSLGHGGKTVSIPIEKQRTIYEQQWYYALISLFTSVMIGLGIWMYSLLKAEAYEKKQAEAVRDERINTELKTAKEIQRASMPHDFPPFPDRKEFDIYATMDPAREVGGDFYDFFMIDSDHLCVVIADVSGKGVPASLFMMVSRTTLRSFAHTGTTPSKILARTNESICADNSIEMFVTVWLGILEISTGRLTAANAGHEYPALTKDGKFELYRDRHGFIIGGMEGMFYKDYKLTLKPGDRLFVYTDGVPEASAADSTMFTTDRMITALNKDPEGTPEQIIENVKADVDAFVAGAEQFDDLTMLCLAYNGPAE